MFSGSFPAIVTPFKHGRVDEEALQNLVKWHLTQGSHGIVVVGTTGESPTLTWEEDKLVINLVIEAANGKVPVIAGAGSNNTAEAIRAIEFLGETGADAALVVAPYYNKPSQKGVIEHYTALNNASTLPIIVYNIPSRSAVDITVETMSTLSTLSRVIGVKDATGVLERVPLQRYFCKTGFIQLSGEDMTVVGFNAMGGCGCISVTANVAPKLCSELQEATLRNDFPKACALQDKLIPLHQAIFAEPGVCGAKAALEILGLCRNEVRLPLVPVSKQVRKKLEVAMHSAGLI